MSSTVKGIIMLAGAVVAIGAATRFINIKHGFWIGAGIFAVGALIPEQTTTSA